MLLFDQWRKRYSLVGLSFFAVFVCYIDRVNISVAIIPMAEEYGWGEATQGLILSCFYFGYMVTQFLGGWLADKFGGKVILAIGVIWWSVFTILTPPAAALGIAILITTRVLMGMGEGVTFPSIYALYGKWIPTRERARSMALTNSGIPIGQVAALVVAPLIAIAWGWEWIFYIFGSVGGIWYVIWYFVTAKDPASHPSISAEESEEIANGLPPANPDQNAKTPILELFKSKPVWAIIVAHFCNNWSLYVLLSWLPTFVTQGLGVDFANSGLVSMAPHLASFVFLNVAGHVADRMVQSGMAVTRVRKICQTIGFGGIAAALFVVGEIEIAWLAITVMCIGNALGAFVTGGFAINHMDIAPNHAGKLMGITNTFGTIPGIIGVTVSGYILEATGSWALVFQVAGGVTVVGLVFYLLLASGDKQFD
ncbi:MAG: ACS family MFS transporter [Pseudomonadota bacterium]|jgi:ACS family sodium-dependent inorganic phosphate cotransporter|nr:ACS family MFS transporter [Pseudomonadota bacterium]